MVPHSYHNHSTSHSSPHSHTHTHPYRHLTTHSSKDHLIFISLSFIVDLQSPSSHLHTHLTRTITLPHSHLMASYPPQTRLIVTPQSPHTSHLPILSHPIHILTLTSYPLYTHITHVTPTSHLPHSHYTLNSHTPHSHIISLYIFLIPP